MVKIDLDFVKELTLKERAELVTGKDFWFTASVPRVKSMMMTDGPSGLRKQADGADALGINASVDAVCFPSSALTASSFDEKMLFKLGENLGIAASAENIGVLLGPGVNIKRSPLAGRNFEYFSEDPLLTGKMGVAYVKGVQSKEVGVSVKHFAANNREDQRFTSSSNIDERTLREIYLSQFERIVTETQPATIMCSYNRLNGVLNSQNQHLLTDILRNEWGFEGFVMSDWGAVADHVAALKAGLDLEMPGKGEASVDEIVTAVKEGQLDEATLNRSVLRILKIVEKWGKNHAEKVNYDKDQQHEFARKLADESIILLKNENQQLPLNTEKSIAIIGKLAQKPRYEGGGSSHVNAHHLVTPFEAAPKNAEYASGYDLTTNEPDNELERKAVDLAKQKDQVVFFAGFPEEMETEGFDKKSIALPENQNHLLTEIIKVNPNVVVVLENGSVVEMPWADQVPAIVETYLAGEAVGEATWDILTGKVNPSGKLSETFPIKLADNPTYLTFDASKKEENYHEGIFVGYRYYDSKGVPVRFPFGHGLSYTEFEYSNLQISEKENSVAVNFEIKNVGQRSGKEVAQLYVGNKTSFIEKPKKELRAFTKVNLEPGESKKVTLFLPRRDFAWYNAEKASWQIDNGSYEIFVGSSVADIRLKDKFTLTIGTTPTVKINRDTYINEIINSKDPVIKKALQTSGLGSELEKILSPENEAIFANMPLRALGMVNIPDEMVKNFIAEAN
ncbi:glycoside hydrolase family 3 C-terminal domain-containing protein [Lactobacillus rodentium]|uniref:Beta-glucosidase n=1 Tax=Lactobacillus rodentium TaxID=947835 RepID=A0A2Z6TDE8_9LACO|nr:glycoside hydrolase family 3 C-terminal domain-containing protein [Lactobacillus rodentium]MCR1894591.1 glycoside hydrolase family 3 C-terminal domain-containing protein [Lactobacillus rodentium]GBG04935.1 beta-glucosidase [Lactobacillus rodentium]